MKASISVSTLMAKNYPTYGFDEELIKLIGDAEVGFKMLIWGASGHGKSTFAAQLCKQLAVYGKVYYNSVEQGQSKSLQDLCRHVGLHELGSDFTIGDRDTYEEMKAKLKKNRAKFVVIDSLQYINLTTSQYKELTEIYKRKSFIIISWEQSGEQPKGEYAKAIRYMCDIKVYVKRGLADVMSRFGATEKYPIPGVYEKFNKNKTEVQGRLF